MVDQLLLIGRLVFVALLYLFLFFVVKTGVGLVKGQNKKIKSWTATVEKGPQALRGVRLTIAGPVVFTLMGTSLMIEDLGSTNGTLLNGRPVTQPTACSPGDIITVGNVDIKTGRS